MRYLKKFNENSHDWASNAMPWASDEEVIKARFGDKDLRKRIQEHPGYQDVAHLNLSDEEMADRLGITPGTPEYKPEEPEEECEPCGDEDGAEGQEELGAEGEEERPTFGSRIKSFLGFGKK